MNKFQLWLSLRTLFTRYRGNSFGFVTLVSVCGMGVGIAALTVTLGILSGFDREYKRILLGFGAHGIIFAQGGIENADQQIQELSEIKELNGIHPFILKEAMISHKGRVKGAILKGIDLEHVKGVLDLENHMEPKKTLAEIFSKPHSRNVILGKTLAEGLNVSIGEVINVVIMKKNARPQWVPFHVGALFYSGMHEFDSRFAYITLGTAQDLFFPMGRVTGIELAISDPNDIERLAPEIEGKLTYPQYLIQWKELNANLFAALKLERVVFFLVILPIVLVGALTVIAALIMFMQERQKGISILRAMGMQKKALFWMVGVQGLLIGILGIGFGFLLGTGINLVLANFPLVKLAPQVYFIDHLPISIQAGDYILIGVSGLIICLLATLIPALKATRLQPVEGIRGF